MVSRKLKVFLCHSSGDKPAVRALYQRLQADGIEPWLDEEDLLYGQKWQQEIPKAVRAADAILVCLSQGSINKDGYVQKEIKHALDVADEKPEGTIFIIPLRFEDCAIPDRFKDWHVGNLFEEKGYEKLLRSLRARASDLGVTVSPVLTSSQPEPLVRLEPTVSNSIGMDFVLIPAGEFQMGSVDGDDGEKPVHRVRMTRPFYLGTYPVTQAQWEAVMGKGNNPSRFKGDLNRPVEFVSWHGAQEFLQRLSQKEGGQPYRLPTEAEWEYAARAGTTTPVGQRKPNAWGLYDMHGNVWEWVQDWYDSVYYQKSPIDDPQGPKEGTVKVRRGGSGLLLPGTARVSACDRLDPGRRDVDIGFRCAR